jgi:hypothetical protein
MPFFSAASSHFSRLIFPSGLFRLAFARQLPDKADKEIA